MLSAKIQGGGKKELCKEQGQMKSILFHNRILIILKWFFVVWELNNQIWLVLFSGATSVVKEVVQKGTKQRYAMKVIEKNVSC